jgi:hypothetical protein
MAERVKEPARPLVKDLMEKSLSGPSLRCLAVAARWAELLLRKED